MAAKKATKKTTATGRPPRVLWLVYHPNDPGEGFTVDTRASAKKNAMKGDRVAGPYVLAERVRER